MHQAHKNRGGALLTALFIMTLVAIVATAMSTRLQLDIYRTRILVNHDKLSLASQAVMFWALSELNKSENKFNKATREGMVSKYPNKLQQIYPNVKLNGGLYDLQARINLNNLVAKKSVILFINLISEIYPKTNDNSKVNLALAVQDWVSTYDLDRGVDAYTSYYASQKPPYYPSHQLMKSSSEFRLIKDVNASMDLKIQPFITVLPEPTPININTASRQVLMSLGDGLDKKQVKEIIAARGSKGIKDIKEILPVLQNANIDKDQITLQSQYFLSVCYAKSEDFTLIAYVLLKRDTAKAGRSGRPSVSVIRESINTF